jgi:UDP-MurNAc hydroxylase
MLPYSGASEYPSCFQNLTFEEKQVGGERKIAGYLTTLERNLRILEPKLILPFAGQYILGGRMAYKNKCLGIPPVERARELITKLGYTALNPQEGDVIDIATGHTESCLPPYSGVTQEEYEEKIRHIPYWYEESFKVNPDYHIDLFSIVQAAREHLWEYQNSFNWHKPYRMMFKVEDSDNNNYLFDYASPEIAKVDPNEIPQQPYLIVSVTYGIFLALLTRHMNWNNAGIGCHIEFYRAPEYYQPEVFALLPYFHV